jgi:hypothetical protein
MGDRVTYVFDQNNASPIFLYGHWAGHNMMANLADAIVFAWDRIQMDDEPYATRQMISHLIGDEWTQETGWGLTTYFCESEHSIPVINVHNKTVKLLPNHWGAKFDINAEPKFTMSMQQFLDKFAKVLV